MKSELTLDALKAQATKFAEIESSHFEPALFGVNDGKAIGTYLEHKFRAHLGINFNFGVGNAALGIDLPGLEVDIKTTSIRQPQSSCPFRSARQKVYGLGYHLLIFVYEKTDDHAAMNAQLNIQHTIFVDKSRTADFQTTTGIIRILDHQGNVDDLKGFFQERNLPIDDIQAESLACEIIQTRPIQGFLTISNALQWRLQYARVIEKAGQFDGIVRL